MVPVKTLGACIIDKRKLAARDFGEVTQNARIAWIIGTQPVRPEV